VTALLFSDLLARSRSRYRPAVPRQPYYPNTRTYQWRPYH
jgi:hypothetical protein